MEDAGIEVDVKPRSKWIMASYGSRELFGQWVSAAFGFSVFFFYETVIGLSSWLAMWAFVIYSIWNAINDPLTGWLMEKVKMPWEKKGFKRFPWIVIGVIPWLISYMMIYFVPSNWYGTPALVEQNQWLIFTWYVVTLCLYDTFLTLYDTNVVSMYPIKFRGINERRTAQTFGTLLGILGLVLAAIIPPLFLDNNVPQTYQVASFVTVGIGIFIFLLILPGVYEDKRVKQHYAKRKEAGEVEEIEPFLRSSAEIVKDRTFMIKVIHFFGYQVGGVMIQTSGFYVTTYILNMPNSALTFLLGAMLLGALFSVPVWNLLSQRVNDNKKIGVIACGLLGVAFIPLIFLNDLIGWIVGLIFFGVAIGANWFIDPPMMGDVLDDIAARTGKLQQAKYYGFQAFFIKFGQTFIAVTIALSHIFTGFEEGSPTQTPLALFGIRIHVAIVPAILMFVTMLLFWKYYNLTPDRIAKNREKLKELGFGQ